MRKYKNLKVPHAAKFLALDAALQDISPSSEIPLALLINAFKEFLYTLQSFAMLSEPIFRDAPTYPDVKVGETKVTSGGEETIIAAKGSRLKKTYIVLPDGTQQEFELPPPPPNKKDDLWAANVGTEYDLWVKKYFDPMEAVVGQGMPALLNNLDEIPPVKGEYRGVDTVITRIKTPAFDRMFLLPIFRRWLSEAIELGKIFEIKDFRSWKKALLNFTSIGTKTSTVPGSKRSQESRDGWSGKDYAKARVLAKKKYCHQKKSTCNRGNSRKGC